jgi:hypothetical protein
VGALSDERAPGFFAAGAALTVALILTVLMAATTVGARSIGVQTEFGKYKSTLNSGFHWTSPFSQTEEFPTTLQPTTVDKVKVVFSAPQDESDKSKAVAGGGTGTVGATARWSISDDQDNLGAKALWQRYTTFDRVVSELVTPSLTSELSDAANDYPAGEASQKQTEIGKAVTDRLAVKLRPYGIIVDSVTVQPIALDKATQASLQRIVDNINKLEAAKIEQQRAIVDNETAKKRAESGALSTANMQRYCLDVVNAWDVEKNGPLPATFNCGLGGGAGLLLQSK